MSNTAELNGTSVNARLTELLLLEFIHVNLVLYIYYAHPLHEK